MQSCSTKYLPGVIGNELPKFWGRKLSNSTIPMHLHRFWNISCSSVWTHKPRVRPISTLPFDYLPVKIVYSTSLFLLGMSQLSIPATACSTDAETAARPSARGVNSTSIASVKQLLPGLHKSQNPIKSWAMCAEWAITLLIGQHAGWVLTETTRHFWREIHEWSIFIQKRIAHDIRLAVDGWDIY